MQTVIEGPMGAAILTMLGEIQRDLGKNTELSKATHEQALKTNGRVNKLEDFVTEQRLYNQKQIDINQRQAETNDQLTNLIEGAWVNNNTTTIDKIDELKNILTPKEELSKKDILNVEGKWKIWAILATGVISIITVVVTYYFNTPK